MIMKRTILFITIAMMGTSLLHADVVANRRDRTMDVFAGAMDKLLLDTRHVYVSLSDHVNGFYLPGTGAFFIGNISITAQASASAYIGQWNKFFSGMELNREKLKNLRNMTKNSGQADQSDIEEIDRELDDLDRELEKKKQKEMSLKEEDIRRTAEMEGHLADFSRELVQSILDFGPVLRGIDANEKIVVVMFVKDAVFQEKYHTHYLMVSVKFSRLNALQDKTVDDPAVGRAFQFNITFPPRHEPDPGSAGK